MQAVSAMNMEFQPLPPVSTMNIGPPAPSPSPHQLQMLTNVPNGNGGGGGGGGGGSGAGGGGGGHNGLGNGSGVHSQLLGPMPPPSILPIGMPLQQVVHNLQHLTNVGGLGMGGNPQQQQQPQQQHQQQQQQQHQQQQQTHQNLLTSNTPGVGNNGLTAIHHGGTQNLPPTSQLLQAIHQNTSNNNNNNGGSGNNNNNNNNNSNTINLNNSNSNINSNNSNNNNNNNTITQYQVQQLWRHHAYLNGNVHLYWIRDFFIRFFYVFLACLSGDLIKLLSATGYYTDLRQYRVIHAISDSSRRRFLKFKLLPGID
uniref:Uncharacterized protein n=1 Tax=Anopheles albimanus TaxID=7167 RepID=A0A182FCR3_ANOAL